MKLNIPFIKTSYSIMKLRLKFII